MIPRSLNQEVAEFCHLLRRNGIRVGTSEAIDAAKALNAIDTTKRSLVYNSLKTTLIKHINDARIFEELFMQFMTELPESPCDLPAIPSVPSKASDEYDSNVEPEYEEGEKKLVEPVSKTEEGEDGSPTFTFSWSPTECKTKARLEDALIRREEVDAVRRAVKFLKRDFATRPGRRFRRSLSSFDRLDFRETLRSSLSSGEILRSVYKKRKLSKTKLVVFLDISGSMKEYFGNIVKQIYILRRVLGGNLEVFLFSTDLTHATRYLEGNYGDVAENLSKTISTWEGGTRIGHCLESFLRQHGELLNKRTVAVIISDGWDLGELELLEDQMKSLKLRANRIIWVNPLFKYKSYRPLCKAMNVALRYTDVFCGPEILARA